MLALPADTPIWVVIPIVVGFALLSQSEKLARLGGWLGAIPKYFWHRQELAVDRDGDLEVRMEAVVDRRNSAQNAALQQTITELLTEMDKRATRWEATAERQERQIADLTAYAEYAIAWVRRVRMDAVPHGWLPALADFLSFEAFRKQRSEDP